MFTSGTDPICESDKLVEGLRSGSLWAHYSGIFSDVGEKVLGGGEGTQKKLSFLFLTVPKHSRVALFLSLTLSKLFLASEKKVFTLWPGSLESRRVPTEQIRRSLSKMVCIFSL